MKKTSYLPNQKMIVFDCFSKINLQEPNSNGKFKDTRKEIDIIAKQLFSQGKNVEKSIKNQIVTPVIKRYKTKMKLYSCLPSMNTRNPSKKLSTVNNYLISEEKQLFKANQIRKKVKPFIGLSSKTVIGYFNVSESRNNKFPKYLE